VKGLRQEKAAKKASAATGKAVDKKKGGSSVSLSSKKPSTGRGPGHGKDKKREKAQLAEHRKRKIDSLESLVDIQQHRMGAFDTYVSDQARLGAFQVAAMSYNMFRDTDEELAAHCSDRMKKLQEDNRDGDDGDMPPLNEV
jgi:hypothetical protein